MKKERKQIDISLLKTPDRNTRIHPDKQIKEIRRSLQKWGQYRDAVVDEQNVVLAGNGLIEAMRAEGFDKVWVVTINGLSENEKVKFMLADNKTAGLGVDNLANIEYLIADLSGDFDIPGFDDDVLKALNASTSEISQALEDYGKATAENLANIDAHIDVNTATIEPDIDAATGFLAKSGFTPKIAETDAGNADTKAVEVSPEGRRFVTCPHCGEVVWL
jgi:hypothetical protein